MKKIIPLVFLILISSQAFALNDSLLDLANPYVQVVRKFTRHGEIYGIKDLNMQYKLYATFQSSEFRKSFTDLYNKLYPDGQDAQADKWGHPWEGQNPQVEFFVGVYAKDRPLKKLSGPKNLWDLSLVIGHQTYKPSLIEEIPLTPFQYKFYPYLNAWSLCYHVVFPIPLAQAEGTPMTLKVANVLGDSKLKFK
jgi:hypothetical protein